MEAIELIEAIGRGEDSRHQFKQNITNPESLAGDLVAFSNSKEGEAFTLARLLEKAGVKVRR